MNTGIFGEGFPYANFHDLNMDWIIKIAKDFLDQYTSIQQIIADGEQSILDKTDNGLTQLQDKADALEELLNQWYTTHSQDIANQLASALQDLNTWYTNHVGYLDQYVEASITSFNQQADAKAETTIASIPDDYTALSNEVADMELKISPFKTVGSNPVDMFYDISIQKKTAGKTYWLQIVTTNGLQQLTVFRTNEASPHSYDSFKHLKSRDATDTGLRRYTVTLDSGEIITVVIDWSKVETGVEYSYYTDIYAYTDAVYMGGSLANFALSKDIRFLTGDKAVFKHDNNLIWYATEDGHTAGDMASSAGYKCTDYIDIDSLIQIDCYLRGGGNTVATIAFYDSSKNYISGLRGGTSNILEPQLYKGNMPVNTKYVRLCTYYTNPNSNYYANLNNRDISVESLYNELSKITKYWAVCGDSITHANHGNIATIPLTDPYYPIDGYAGTSYNRKNYAYYIAQQMKINWANYGYGGSTLHHCAPKAYSNINFYPFVDTRIEYLKAGIEWDYITIFFGWNDNAYGPTYQRDLWLQETYGDDIGYPVTEAQIGTTGFANAEQKYACDHATGYVGDIEYTNTEQYFYHRFIGTINDNTKNTWYGAWNYALSYLLRKYPKCKIMIVVPYLQEYSNDVRQAVRDIAQKWGVLYFDFNDIPYWYNKSNINNTPFAPTTGNWTTESGATCPNTVEGYNKSKYSYDGLHPSNLGYQTIAEPFKQKLLD